MLKTHWQTMTEIEITYKYTACGNRTWRDVADIMDSGHRLGVGINCFAIHEILRSPRTTNEGNINLRNNSVPWKVGVENRTHAHELCVEEDRRKGVLAAPILMKDWYINT